MLTYLCIGAQKAGTTWLYTQLRKHPDISPLPKKEFHFWDRHAELGIEWYQNQFTDPIKAEGDCTPAYAILPPEAIAECHRYFPDLRLIFIVRDPIARTWAAVKMFLYWLRMEIDEASDQFFLDCFRAHNVRLRANYALSVHHWLQHYKREQLLILHFDDIALHPEAFLKRCHRHIGVSDLPLPPLDELRQVVRPGPSIPLRPSLLPILKDIYPPEEWVMFQPFIERLSTLT